MTYIWGRLLIITLTILGLHTVFGVLLRVLWTQDKAWSVVQGSSGLLHGWNGDLLPELYNYTKKVMTNLNKIQFYGKSQLAIFWQTILQKVKFHANKWMVCFCNRMAVNSQLSRMAGEDEQYTFCWKLFTTWDYMIGLAETAKNKMAEIVTIFKVGEKCWNKIK